MLGYVVKSINVSENTAKIDNIQRNCLADIEVSAMEAVCESADGFSRYQCIYKSTNANIELTHLFYDFSDVVEL